MSTPGLHATDLTEVSFADLLDRVSGRIAPLWPLDRSIAVNPLWGFIDRPMAEAATHIEALSGARMTMPRSWYGERFAEGAFCARDIDVAIDALDAPCTRDEALAALEGVEPVTVRRQRMTDILDARHDPSRERPCSEVVREDLSQHCAAWFDRGQAALRPARDAGLYAAWRDRAAADPSLPFLLGLPVKPALHALPCDAHGVFSMVLRALDVPVGHWEAYLTGLLHDIHGWASWCAFQRFSARLEERDDDVIVELLAARLAWEWVLWTSADDLVRAGWQRALHAWPDSETDMGRIRAVDWVLQTAFEGAYHRRLGDSLVATAGARPLEDVSVQAAFCIDVRSEVLRRALEAESSQVHTLGFAGFFGLPAEYRAVGSQEGVPQLPGLLRPQVRVTDTGVSDLTATTRRRRLGVQAAWKQFRYAALSGFSFVEAVGLLYAPKLLSDALGVTRPLVSPKRAGLSDAEHRRRKPRLTESTTGEPLDTGARAELAAGILRNMSLTRDFARVVALVGHGSHSVNNPHASGLDCGACCGQSGEVNARAVASLLNESSVREALSERGIRIPEQTWFVPALHDTTTEEVTLFDLDEVPADHEADLARLRAWFSGAAERARAERAARRGEDEDTPLRERFAHRARDWSQVRPEWGLAGNASFVVAPRERTRDLVLDGRAFLHEYRWEDDQDGRILEGILTAPMVVTHWINLQYYASTVDNRHFGSGNKVLHNVVGGGIGVFEGTGGDLRTGLPMQSLHDGTRYVHEPIRLGVFVEAPRERVAAIVDEHETVRHLVAHGWLRLFVLDPQTGGCEPLGA